jgi:hypothetical protein
VPFLKSSAYWRHRKPCTLPSGPIKYPATSPLALMLAAKVP